MIDEDVVNFPAVTICNLNLFKRSLIEQENQLVINITRTLHPTYFVPSPLNLADPRDLELTKGFNFAKIYDRIKINSLDVFGGCHFNTIQLRCSDYIEPVITNIGECATFNNRNITKRFNNITTSRAGVANGLRLHLSVAHFEYFSGTLAAGFKVSR